MLKKTSEKSDHKQRTMLLKSAFSMAAVFLVLVIGIYAITADTKGWFSMNQEVDADGIGVIPQGLLIDAVYFVKNTDMDTEGEFREVTAWDEIFQDLYPGSRVTIRVVYTNNMEENYMLGLRLDVPADGEIPLETDTDGDGTKDTFYYFGSQIVLGRYSVNEGTAVTHGERLVANPTEAVSFDAKLAPVPNLTVCEDLPLNAGDTLTVDLELEFVNLPTVDQNAYQNFGAADSPGVCKRVLNAVLKKVSEN